MTNFTSYTNGTIRNAEGKLVAHFTEATGELLIDGIPHGIYATDIEHAMDLVAERAAH